jgi:hypothetical protein
VDGVGEGAGLVEVGGGGLAPHEVGVGRVGEAAGDGGLEAALDAEEAPRVRSPVRNGRSRSSTSLVSSLALSASVRATSRVGTPITSAARRAATSVRMNCAGRHQHLAAEVAALLLRASWSSKCTPAAPASIMAFISSRR